MSSVDASPLYEPDNWDDLRAPAIALNVGSTNPPAIGLFRDSTSGLTAKALEFDGVDEWASLASNAAYTTGVGASLTWAFWMQPTVTQPASTVPLLAKDGKWALQLRRQGALWYIRLFVDGSPVAQSSSPVVMGQRNLVMFQLLDTAGTTCCYRIKLNNTLVIDYTDGVVDSNAAVRVARGFSLAGFYSGKFDEMIAYAGTALDNATVSNGLWNSGNGTATPPTDTGITVTSHWKCDEIVANEVPDENTVVNLVLGDGAGAEAPELVTPGLIATSSSRGVYTLFFAPGETQEAFLALQLPHGYKLGSDLKAHVHWAPTDNQAGDVVWGFEYTFQAANAVFPATSSLEATKASPGEAYHHEISGLGSIPALGSANDTSAMLLGRIYRKGSAAEDTYPGAVALLEFDIHYQSDKAGTMIEFGPT